jgi:hypothetical protein
MQFASSRAIAAATFAAMLLLPIASLQAAGTQILHGNVPEAVAVSKAVGPLSPATRMNLAIGLPLRNQANLETLLRQLADPASPNSRRYLTSAEFTERFGPAEADYRALAAFMRASGLEVTGTHPNRMIVDVSGSVADIETTFHIKVMNWRHPTRGDFFAPDRDPSLDAGVAILSISGLDNFVVPRPMDLRTLPLSEAKPMTSGSGPGGLFIGGDFRAAYAPGVMLNGTGMSVGLFELDGFYASDVAANFAQAGLPPVPTQTVLLDGFNGAPGSGNIEVTLDIMMAAYMAPGLTSVIVYEGANPDDVLNRMATDNLASQLSSSWGWSPTDATTEQIFKEMIAQGQSMFQASGDGGAYTDGVMPPADDPNVTSVGGTSLTTAGAGGPWQSETTWSGSGGGVSTVWPIPSYQQSVNMTAAGGSATMRNMPDVALVAAIQMFLICNDGEAISVGGTSAATPLWAGFTALANQQAAASGQPRVGFVNPPLYALGGTSSYNGDLHDITTGNNGGFNAMPGYDLATGWGTPAGQPLINSLTGVANAPAFGLSSSASSLSIAPGTSGSVTITVTPQNGFSGAVTLAASGLPTGVTALFSPAAATTASTLTLTVAASTAAGPSTVTITGTSGSLTSTVRLTVTVTGPPTFTLAASLASVSVAPGATSTSAITVNPLYGFTGTVSLKASGLPSGVTAAFSPASTTGTSTLTFTAASSAALNTSTVTVTGTSGSLSITSTISLTVALPPSYTLSASPASLTVAPWNTGVSTISANPLNGFNGSISVSFSGVPAGVSASFSPANQAWAITLNLAVGASAAPGTYPVTITGTSGSLSQTTTVTLTIPGASTFTLSAAPSSVTVAAGATGASTITAAPQDGFSGTVTLAASGLPTGVTASFSALSSAHTSTLTFTAAASTTLGAATVTVTGASGTTVVKTTVALTITAPPSFTLSASPSSLSVSPGGSGASTITVAESGFNGSVSLAVSGLPSGVTGTFSPSSTAATSTLTLNATSAAAATTATVTVTGTSGSMTSKVAISLTVTPPPSFTLVSSPGSTSFAAGGAGGSTIGVAPQNGFTGTVSFKVSGLPTGVTANFTPPSSTVASNLTLMASASTASGTSTLTITGTSGSLTATTTLSLTIAGAPSFTLSASPAAVTVSPGGSGASTVTVNQQNGFGGLVGLKIAGLPSGVTGAFSPATTNGGSALTIAASSSAAAGKSTLTVTGTSGSLSATTTISLTVTAPPSYTLSASPSSVTVAQGGNGTSTITVTPQNGFSGTVALAASGLPTGVTASFSPASATSASTLTLSASSSATKGTSTVTITGTSGSLSSKATISLTIGPPPSFTLSATPASLSLAQGASASSTIAVGDVSGFSGTVALKASGMPNGVTASFSPASSTSKSTVTFTAAGSATPAPSTVTITGTSGSLTSTVAIALTISPPPGFTLSATPASLSLAQGASASSTIAVGDVSGFSGTVALTASGMPNGVTAGFSPASSTSKSTVTFTASATANVAPWTATITGTSGSLTSSVTIPVIMTASPNFTLTSTPGIVNLNPGASGASTIAIVDQNGFSGTVALTASGLPTGVTAAFSPAGTATRSTVTFTAAGNASAASATVTITGKSGSLTSQLTIQLTVTPPPTFTLSTSPTTLSIAASSSGTSTLTLNPQNGFTGTVMVSLSGLPTGVTGSFGPGSTAPTLLLTLTATSAAKPGSSTVTITGKSGSLTETATISLTVTAASSASGNGQVSMASLYNVSGLVTDGSTFTGGGLDGGGRAWSANLLGTSQTVNGQQFGLGPANAPDAVTSATIPLPAGQFSTLTLLATGVNGAQLAQTFTVTYADGSTATFTQSLSDWCTPAGYPGESNAVPMTYRDNSTGTRDTRPIALYGYSFSLASAKTTASITLPKNRNVVVLAISLH